MTKSRFRTRAPVCTVGVLALHASITSLPGDASAADPTARKDVRYVSYVGLGSGERSTKPLYEDALVRLIEIEALRPGWDGADAWTPNPKAIHAAALVLATAARIDPGGRLRPEPAPVVDSTILIEFRLGMKEVQVECGADEALFGLLVAGDDRDDEYEGDMTAVVSALEWLLA